MKKHLLIFLFLCFKFFHLWASSVSPQPVTRNIGVGATQPCDTVFRSITIKNDSLASVFFNDTLIIDYNNIATDFSAQILHGTGTISDSIGYTKIVLNPFSLRDSVVVQYKYYIPCSVIQTGSSSGNISWAELNTVSRHYLGLASSYPANSSFGYQIAYANLYIAPTSNSYTNLSAEATVGEQISRRIVLESNALLGANFDGYINVSDSIVNSCNMFRIDSFIAEIINPVTSGRSVAHSIGFTPSRISGSSYLVTAPVHVILDNARGDYLEIREVIHVVSDSLYNCIDNCVSNRIESRITIDYGCDSSSLCKRLQTSAYIYRGSARPHIIESISSTLGLPDTCCFRNPSFSSLPVSSDFITYRRVIRNIGVSTAFDVNWILRSPLRTSEVLIKSWLNCSYNGASFPASRIEYYLNPPIRDISVMPTCVNSFRNLIAISDTDAYTPIYNAIWHLPVLKSGDSIVIEYSTYRCCPNDLDRYVGSLANSEYFDTWSVNGFLDSLDNSYTRYIARDDCGSELSLGIASNSGIQQADLDVGGIQGPAHLTGQNDTCNPSRTAIYEVPIIKFCNGSSATINGPLLRRSGVLSGQLIVEVITDHGLNPLPTLGFPMAIEGSLAVGSRYRYGVLDSSSYLPSGGFARIHFNIDSLRNNPSSSYSSFTQFIEGGYLRIPIIPCCNGAPAPGIRVRIYLLPERGNSGSCMDCKIPIAESSRRIYLHCPGCVTPGIIADNCKIRRSSVGYPDLDNNGLADVSTPYTNIDSITRNRYAGSVFIPGDQINIQFDGFGQDGDDANGGYTYQTLRNYWTSLHTSSPSHPQAFTHLYIYVKNPCAATNRFNWQVLSDSLSWSRPGGLNATLYLNPYNIHGENYLFYRIPIDAIGDSVSTDDIYHVNIKAKACSNSFASDCDISTYMWWSADSTLPFNAYDLMTVAGEANAPYHDSLLGTRLFHAGLSDLYLCEASGDLMKAYKLKRSYSSYWLNDANPIFSGSTTCDKKLVNTYMAKVVDEDENISNLFPYEYRPLPIDFDIDHFKIPPSVIPNYSLADISTTGSYNNWILTTSPVIRNSNLGTYSSAYSYANYTLPMGAIMAMDPSPPVSPSPGFVQGDEKNLIQLTYRFIPTTCGRPDSFITVKVDSNYAALQYEYCTGFLHRDTLREFASTALKLRNPNPKIQINQLSGPVVVYSTGPSCFTIRVKNNGLSQQLAENVWLHAVKPGLDGEILSMHVLGSSAGVGIDTSYTDSDSGIITHINHLARNQYLDLEICFAINSCQSPYNIMLYFGYTCVSGTNCYRDTLKIKVDTAQVGITHIAPVTSISTEQCKPDTIACGFKLRFPGEVDHIGMGIVVPSGVRILDESATYAIIGPPVGASVSLPILSRTETVNDTVRTLHYTFNDTIALHGTPTRLRNEIEIQITFSISTCIDTPFVPKIYIDAYNYCNAVVSDTVKSITIRPIMGSCPDFVLKLDSIADAKCNGSQDGYIRIQALASADSMGRVRYIWSTGDTTPFISGLTAGIYSITVTNRYGCRMTRTDTVHALSQPVQLPAILYRPYTTCDLRKDSLVFAPYIPPGPGPWPIPAYTYTWHASNMASGFADSGVIPGGSTSQHTIVLRFADSLRGSEITIRATDADGCFNEMKLWVEPCCVRAEQLISNTKLSEFFTEPSLRDGSGTYHITGGSYRINGVFTIDRNCLFTAGDFYMEPFSQIVILPNLNVSIAQKTIVACDTTMWKGIAVGRNSVLNVGNATRIYDALIAIKTDLNAVYKIYDSYFNRNRIDISTINHKGAANPSSIRGSYLYSHNESPEFYGNTLPASGGRLWWPHRNEQSYIGIQVAYSDSLIIGDTTLNPLKANHIEDKNYGVYIRESKVEIVNNDFHQIRAIEGLVRTVDSMGNAIYFEALSDSLPLSKLLYAHDNTFIGIQHTGIVMTGPRVQASVNNNQMRTTYMGILGKNLTDTSGVYRKVIIQNNNIEYDGIGIGFDDVRRVSIGIFSDTLTASSRVLRFGVQKTGIRIGVIYGMESYTPKIRIANNRIYNGRSGIYVQNIAVRTPRNQISQNYIASTLADPDFTGILLSNSWGLNINNNAITGRPGVATDRTSEIINKKGIWLKDSPLNTVNCNSMDYLNKGFVWTGNCLMPNSLFGNAFNHLGNHMYCSDTLGILYHQEYANTGAAIHQFVANKFNSMANRYSIYNRGDVFNYYRMFAGVPFDPWYFTAFTPPLVPLGAVPQPTSLSPYGCLLSPSSGAFRLADTSFVTGDSIEIDTETLAKIIDKTEGLYDEESKGLEYLNKEMLYDLLKNDSVSFDNDSLLAYYNALKESHTGLIDLLKAALYKKDYSLMQSKLMELNSTSYVEEANARFFNTIYSIDKRSEEMSIIQETADAIDNALSVQPTDINLEEDYYGLEQKELDELLDLASLCPIRYGQAVYSARVIVNTVPGYEDLGWDDERICVAGVNYKRDHSDPDDKKEIVINDNIQIHPNPARDELYFTASEKDRSKCNELRGYSIMDGAGRKISALQFDSSKRQGVINVSKFAEGLYIIYFDCTDDSRVMFKFVINR